MLRLHGYPVSNYFNIARAALIEKNLEHEIRIIRASQEPAFLARSPMGKIPVLETEQGSIAETVAIVEYLDDRYPDRPLHPADPFERARARQIVNVMQMYVEAPSRSIFAGVFVKGPAVAALQASARAMLDRSTAALSRLLKPQPFVSGTQPGAADLFTFYNLDIADRVTRFVFDRSIVEEIGGLADWIDAMAQRQSTQTVLAAFTPAFHQYLVDHDAPFRERDDTSGILCNA